MGKQKTAYELQQEQEMLKFIEQNPGIIDRVKNYEGGAVTSSMQQAVEEQEIQQEIQKREAEALEQEAVEQQEEALDEAVQETQKPIEEQTIEQPAEQTEDTPIEISPTDDDTKVPPPSKPEQQQTDIDKKIHQQNKEVAESNKSDLQKLYYSTLAPEAIVIKEQYEKEIAALYKDEANFSMQTLIKASPDGPQTVHKSIMTPEAKARLTELKTKHKELIRPSVEVFTSLIDDKIKRAKAIQKSDETPYFSHRYSEAHLSEVLYKKSKEIAEAHLDDSGMWQAFKDGVSDEDFYTLGSAKLETLARLYAISKKNNAGKQLDEGENQLVEAFITHQDAQQLALGNAYSMMKGATESIPFMAEFAATRGMATGVEKGVASFVQKYAKKHLNKSLKRTIGSTVIKNTSKAIGAVTGSATQTVFMPMAYENILERKVGDFQVDRDVEGLVSKVYSGDNLKAKIQEESDFMQEFIKSNPENYNPDGNLKLEKEEEYQMYKQMAAEAGTTSWGEAIYKGGMATFLENWTERVGGERIVKLFGRAGIKSPFKLPAGKWTPYMDNFKRAVGFHGFIPEVLEEEMIIPMDALFVGDSKFSDLLDGQQQLQTIGQVGIITTLMGAGAFGLNNISKLRNREFYKKRKDFLTHVNNIRKANPNKLDELLRLSATATDVTQLKLQEQQLRKEGLIEEADKLNASIFQNQVIRAFDTHSVEPFEKALQEVQSNPEASEIVKKNAAKALATLAELKRPYEKFSKLPNISSIIRLKANKILARNTIQEIDQQLLEVSEEVSEDLEAFESVRGVNLPTYSAEELLNREFTPEDENLRDGHEGLLEEIRKENLLSFNTYEGLLATKKIVQSLGSDAIMMFNEAVSPQYQQSLKDVSELSKELYKDKRIKTAIEQDDMSGLDEAVGNIFSKFKGTISKAKLIEIKKDFLGRVAQMKMAKQQMNSQKKAGKLYKELNKKDNKELDNLSKKYNKDKAAILKGEGTEQEKQEAHEQLAKEYNTKTAPLYLRIKKRAQQLEQGIGYEDAKTKSINEKLQQQFTEQANSLQSSITATTARVDKTTKMVKSAAVEKIEKSRQDALTELENKHKFQERIDWLKTNKDTKQGYLGDKSQNEAVKEVREIIRELSYFIELHEKHSNFKQWYESLDKEQEAKIASRSNDILNNVYNIKFELFDEFSIRKAFDKGIEYVRNNTIPGIQGQQDYRIDQINKKYDAQLKTIGQEATVVKDEAKGIFDSPKKISKNLSKAQKEAIASNIKAMYETLEKELGKAPTFKQFVTRFTESTSLEHAEEYYNVISLGWELNEYKETDFVKEYNTIFDPFKKLAADLMADDTIFGETEETIRIEDKKQFKAIQRSQSPIEGFDENNAPIIPISRRTVASNLKLAFVSMAYDEVINDQGVVERITKGTTLLESPFVKSTQLLHPDKFNAGDNLRVAIPEASVLDEVPMTERHEDGTKTVTSYKEWLAEKVKTDPNFENTEEYRNRVPIFVYTMEGEPVAMIHDSAWYNKHTVGHENNPPKQAEVIKDATSNVIELRTKIFEGLDTITIQQKTGFIYEKLEDDQPMKTISEMNPQSIMATGTSNGTLLLGKDVPFEDQTRTIIYGEHVKNGYTYQLVRVGLDENGKQTWKPFQVGSRGDKENDYGLTDEEFNTVKWIFAAAMKHRGYDSVLKGRFDKITKEQADAIVDNIYKLTRYDVGNIGQMWELLKHFTTFKRTDKSPVQLNEVQKRDFESIGEVLFGEDQTVAKQFVTNTQRELVRDTKMFSISEDGKFTDLKQGYNEYLKDRTKTHRLSFNIGTEQEPVYVTNVQPKIYFTFQGVSPAQQIKDAAKQAKENLGVQETGESVKESDNIENRVDDLLDKYGFSEDVTFDAPKQVKDDTLLKGIFNTIPGLSIMEEGQIVDYLFNAISESIEIKKGVSVNKTLLLSRLAGSFKSIVEPSKKEFESIREHITELYNKNPEKFPNLLPRINEINRVLNIYKSIEDNWKELETKALAKLLQYTGITENNSEEDESVSLRVKEYSKSILEENGKDKATYRLRRFFAGTKERTAKGEEKRGFLGLPVYVPFNEVYNTIAQILSSPNETESDFVTMMEKLNTAKESHTWIPSMIERLQKADPQIQKEFVYNFTKHTLSMKFAMYSVNSRGGYDLKVYDTNAHEITRLIREGWKNNFKVGRLVNSSQEGYSINKVAAQVALDELEGWGIDPHNIDDSKTRLWLQNFFGVNFSTDAWHTLFKRGVYYSGERLEYRELFTSPKGIFKLTKDYLKFIVTEKNTEFIENEANHPFTNMQGVLKALSILESQFTNQAMTLSFRDNGKSIFGLTPNKFSTDRVMKLKQFDPLTNENEFVNDLKDLSFSSESYVLDLLTQLKEFRSKFGIDHIGITALKQYGKKASLYSGITDLNDIDHDLAKLVFFQDTKQGTVDATLGEDGKVKKGGEGIGMRIARMFLPTMSDKSQMLMLSTGVFNFFADRRKSFSSITEDGGVVLTDTVKNLLFNQLVKPEIKRILAYHKRQSISDINDYDVGAMVFNLIPSLNNVKDEEGNRLIELMSFEPETFNMEWIEENFRDQIDEKVKSAIDATVQEKREEWEVNIERKKSGEIKNIKYFDSTYLKETVGTLDEKLTYGLYDFALNSFLSNANMFTLLAGDPALYTQQKLFKSFPVDHDVIKVIAQSYGKESLFRAYSSFSDFTEHLNELYAGDKISKALYEHMKTNVKPMAYAGQDNQYMEIAKKSGVNLGKRLALLIAPGYKIANSKGVKYKQLFLKDPIDISENSEFLIELYYGKEAAETSSDVIKEYHDTDNEAEKNRLRGILQERFPKISDYFEMETADGQELTTVNEHLAILDGQGRIPTDVLEDIKKTLEDGKDLSLTQLGFVLQPIKPVHTGQIVDKEQDVLRTVYIKSSSYPLLPQLTKSRKLNTLRLNLERLEKANPDMTVRASYQSANKVGAKNNPVNPFEDLTLEQLEASSLTLSREDFRIQQDVPFHSDKARVDMVSMGTQIFKILFGDGMLERDGFEINGKVLNGVQLYNYFTEVFGKLITSKKQGLYKELGLNNDGLPIDEEKSMKKLQKLLKDEAEKRRYPRQDIEGLTFEQEEIPNTDIKYWDFKLPLWISANANRYESLLNAIIVNRVIAQKMPGNSFVVGSEDGYQILDDLSQIDGSQIVHIGDYKGGELKGVHFDSEGKIVPAQILVTSKFKDNQGNLIDLLEAGSKGREYKYLRKDTEGRLVLDMDRVPLELIENFTFRTPTSFHASASLVQIAGFLPSLSGDLMIVPKNFTKQKGLDYDVDKETAYQLHHIYNPVTGEIEVLSDKHRKRVTAGLQKAMKRAEGFTIDDEATRMLEAIFGKSELTNMVEDELRDDKEKIEAKLRQFEQKLLENEFVKVHMSVYGNSDIEVQKRLAKILSMNFARQQAEYIEALNTEGKDDSNFTILSDSYQRNKMGLGAVGKMAIGTYSNYVTLHSLAQIVRGTDEAIQMTEQDEARGNKNIVIGNFVSTGEIGLRETLDGGRYISEAFAERQNTATDNEKEQILGRVNVNSLTINVDSILTLLGFDRGEKVDGNETSIPYLLLSQPIIKAFVKKTQSYQAITADYQYNMDERVIKELKQEFKDLGETDFDNTELTSENMVKGIKGEYIPGMQIAVLELFLDLNDYAKKLASIQAAADISDLGKSIIETNDKFNKLASLPYSKHFRNAEKLVGDFRPIENDQIPDGYQVIGNFYVKPTTPQGHITITGVTIGNALWNDYFPYADPNFTIAVEEVMKITNAKDRSDKKIIELKFEIFKEIKRYLNSDIENGLFEESASLERELLFIDSNDNQSLAHYLNTLKNSSIMNIDAGLRKGAHFVKTNRLFSKFEYDINTNGEPSLVKYNNTSMDNFDEDYLYTAIAEMVLNEYPLPDKNGKPYNTKMLAADLAAYSLLEGGVQEAIQFVKYIPVEYLETMGFAKQMRKYSPKRMSNIFGEKLGIKILDKLNQHETHTFVKQFAQHNPEMVTQFPKNEDYLYFGKVEGEKNTSEKFFFKGEGTPPKFITRKNTTKSKRKQDKFSLYQHIGNGYFQKISILGAHGMNEYEVGNEDMHSLLDNAEPAIAKSKPNDIEKSSKSDPFTDVLKLDSGTVAEILTNITNMKTRKYKHFKFLAGILSEALPKNLKFSVGDTTKGGQFETEAGGRTIRNADGSFEVILDKATFLEGDHENSAKIIMHEFIHVATAGYLLKYFDRKTGKPLTTALPPYVERLYRVFNKTKRELGPKVGEFLERRASIEQGTYPKGEYDEGQLEIDYAGVDIFEFVAVALTEPEFQKAMSEVYYKSGESLFKRFQTIIASMLLSIGLSKIGRNNVTYESVDSILEFMNAEVKLSEQEKSFFEKKKPQLPQKFKNKHLKNLEDTEKEIGRTTKTDRINDILGLPKEDDTFDIPKELEIYQVFEDTPELSEIGTQNQYATYLESIFPDSKVTDVMYHGTASFEGEQFDARKLKKEGTSSAGFHFTTRDNAKIYASVAGMQRESNSTVIPVLLNMVNPKFMEDITGLRGKIGAWLNPKQVANNLMKEGFDSISIESYGGAVDNIVFNSNQIHILGSPSDIKGFSNFTQNALPVNNLPNICQ